MVWSSIDSWISFTISIIEEGKGRIIYIAVYNLTFGITYEGPVSYTNTEGLIAWGATGTPGAHPGDSIGIEITLANQGDVDDTLWTQLISSPSMPPTGGDANPWEGWVTTLTPVNILWDGMTMPAGPVTITINAGHVIPG